ncbi:MAG: hypothetical protein EAY81_05075 [Bacteroidetes bacterium]|nr:MAG: hypothetical protein EAY81_05075 [Bacteroidota bacterium]
MRSSLILLVIIYVLTSCSDNNTVVMAHQNNTHNITEDSVIKILNLLKNDHPDTFIFLNYWQGMPLEFIHILNSVNVKEKNIKSDKESMSQSLDDLSYTFLTKPEISSSLIFILDDSLQHLIAIELTNTWETSTNKPNEGIGLDIVTGEMKYFWRAENIKKEITSLYQHFNYLFGKPKESRFDKRLHLLLHKNMLNQFLNYSNHLTHSSIKPVDLPIRVASWTINKRAIFSVCTESIKTQNNDISDQQFLGTRIENRILFTHIDHVETLLKNYNSQKNASDSVNEFKRRLQREKI